MLGMDPSPDPSRCARRVPCCQASAASTDMWSVGNSGSLGWIKINCHMFWCMKINQHQLVWCQLTHNIPKPHCPSKTISAFKQGLQSCFESIHWFRILGNYLWALYLSLPTIRNLSVSMADALEAALPVLRQRRHSKDTCCWADASSVVRFLPQTVIDWCVLMCGFGDQICFEQGATQSRFPMLRGVDDWGLLRIWGQWRISWKLETYRFSWLKQPSAKVLLTWHG